MLITVLLFMSLAGSVVLVMQMAVHFLTMKVLSFSARWHYRMLDLSMIFFLLPVCQLKEYLMKSRGLAEAGSGSLRSVSYYTIYYTPEGSLLTPKNIGFFLTVGVWIAGMLIRLGLYVQSYVKFRGLVLQTSSPVDDASITDIFETCKARIGIKRNVLLLKGEIFDSPVAMGMSHPMVILPDYHFDEVELTYIFEHELIHIKHRDVWKKIIGILISCIHWFNPFAYLLKNEIERWAELACDEELAVDKTKEQRKAYCLFILDVLEQSAALPRYFLSASGGGKKTIKERLEYVMYSKKRSGKVVGTSVVIALLITMLSAGVVFAMDKPVEVRMSETYIQEEEKAVLTVEGFYFINGESEMEIEDVNAANAIVSEEGIFIAEDGARITVKGIITNDGKAPYCNHVFGAGIYEQHLLYSDGSCKINYYNAQICTKCNYVIIGDINGQATFKKCFH